MSSWFKADSTKDWIKQFYIPTTTTHTPIFLLSTISQIWIFHVSYIHEPNHDTSPQHSFRSSRLHFHDHSPHDFHKTMSMNINTILPLSMMIVNEIVNLIHSLRNLGAKATLFPWKKFSWKKVKILQNYRFPYRFPYRTVSRTGSRTGNNSDRNLILSSPGWIPNKKSRKKKQMLMPTTANKHPPTSYTLNVAHLSYSRISYITSVYTTTNRSELYTPPQIEVSCIQHHWYTTPKLYNTTTIQHNDELQQCHNNESHIWDRTNIQTMSERDEIGNGWLYQRIWSIPESERWE